MRARETENEMKVIYDTSDNRLETEARTSFTDERGPGIEVIFTIPRTGYVETPDTDRITSFTAVLTPDEAKLLSKQIDDAVRRL